MSVPGRIACHSSARAAVLVYRGSRTTSFWPFFRAVIRSILSGVIRASNRLAPAMMMYLEWSTSAKGTSPNVSRYARFRLMRQLDSWVTTFQDPNTDAKR